MDDPPTASSGFRSSTTIRLTGGTIAGATRDGSFESVTITTGPGWTSQLMEETTTRRTVRFRSGYSTAEVFLEVSSTGVTSHTRTID